jgi:uncharacterized membrane protein (Fun14 family)
MEENGGKKALAKKLGNKMAGRKNGMVYGLPLTSTFDLDFQAAVPSYHHCCTMFRPTIIFSHRGNALFRPSKAQGVSVSVARSVTNFRPSCSTSKAAMLQPPPSSPTTLASTYCRGPTVIGILSSSLAYSTITMTTLTLCDSNKNNKDKDSINNDEDFISKIKSKLESQNFSLDNLPPIDNETLTSIASSLGTQISSAVSTGIPTDVSYGFFAGYLSGLALKKIGKVASLTLGITFLGLQSLAYAGYIDVHHDKLQKQVEEMLDRNKDGVVDSDDLRSVIEEVRKVAGFGLEDTNLVAKTGGFGLGFWGGLRSG